MPKFDEYDPRSTTAVYKPTPDTAQAVRQEKAGLQQERERAEDGTGRKYAVVKECEIEKMSSMQANRKMRNRVQTK